MMASSEEESPLNLGDMDDSMSEDVMDEGLDKENGMMETFYEEESVSHACQ